MNLREIPSPAPSGSFSPSYVPIRR